MTTPALTPLRPGPQTGQAGFGQLLWAEWIKFRTVRGWVIGMIIAALVTVGIALLDHSSCGGVITPGGPSIVGAGCAAPPDGPGGEAVTDNFYFVHRPLEGNGSITARVTSLTAGRGPAGLQPWSKAGIIVKASTRPGSAYAAMMVTAGHGVRMQYDYTGDIAGRPGTVSAVSPRWLRLTRSGDILTGYQSADGTHWNVAGTAHLAGLPATVLAGMFAASPTSAQSTSAQSISGSSGGSALTVATATFDHLGVRGQRPRGAWAGDMVGGASPGTGFHQAGGTVTVTGSGDIAPYVAASGAGGGFAIGHTLLGAFGGLIAVIVVATMFMTAEYRRGLIRVTFTASPARGRVLATKAIVIGSVTFIAGLAGAVTAVIAAIVLPYLLAITALPAGASDWLLRVTPAAAFAIQQTTPQYPQVSASYTPGNGYFPPAPWAGFAVLCGYAALALALAMTLLRRRDA